jgi:predicted DNA-binding transcriptional regulator AlpA
MSIELLQISKGGLEPINERLERLENLITSFKGFTKEEKELLSRKETAQFFGISVVTLHSWVNKGTITPHKIEGRTYFLRSELMDVLLNSKTEVA